MKRIVREKIFQKDLRRHGGLWVCQPEPEVKAIIASGDIKDEAIERAVILGTAEPFTFFVIPGTKGGET